MFFFLKVSIAALSISLKKTSSYGMPRSVSAFSGAPIPEHTVASLIFSIFLLFGMIANIRIYKR